MSPTVDIHQHLWPRTFLDALDARVTPPFVRKGVLHTVEGAFPLDLRVHDPEVRIAELDRDGIDVAVLSLQTTLGLELLPAGEQDELEEAWLEGMAELVADASGRFRAFAPGRAVDGFVGVSVGASALVDPGDATGLDEVEAAGAVLFVHPEAEGPSRDGLPDWWQWSAGYTAQMQRAYLAWLGGGRDRYPTLRVVFAILAGGGPIQHERLIHRGVDVRSALDTRIFFDTATYGRRAIELAIETFGVERLVYGSDTPVVDPRPTLAAVNGFGESVAQLLQADTPGALLG